MQRVDISKEIRLLAAGVKEAGESEKRLSEAAAELVPILQSVLVSFSSMRVSFSGEEAKIVQQAVTFYKVLSSPTDLWPPVLNLTNQTVDSLFSMLCDINEKLGNKEKNAAYLERMRCCAWISLHYTNLLAILARLSLDDGNKEIIRRCLIAPAQRLPKLPLFSREWLAIASNKLQSVDLKNVTESLHRKFLRVTSALNQLVKASEQEKHLQDNTRSWGSMLASFMGHSNQLVIPTTTEQALLENFASNLSMSYQFPLNDEQALAQLNGSVIASAEGLTRNDDSERVEELEKSVRELEQSATFHFLVQAEARQTVEQLLAQLKEENTILIALNREWQDAVKQAKDPAQADKELRDKWDKYFLEQYLAEFPYSKNVGDFSVLIKSIQDKDFKHSLKDLAKEVVPDITRQKTDGLSSAAIMQSPAFLLLKDTQALVDAVLNGNAAEKKTAISDYEEKYTHTSFKFAKLALAVLIAAVTMVVVAAAITGFCAIVGTLFGGPAGTVLGGVTGLVEGVVTGAGVGVAVASAITGVSVGVASGYFLFQPDNFTKVARGVAREAPRLQR